MAAPSNPEASSQHTWGVLSTWKNPTFPASSSEPTLHGKKGNFSFASMLLSKLRSADVVLLEEKGTGLTQHPPLRQMAGHTVVRIIGFILLILDKKVKIRKQVPSDILKNTWAGISSSYM